MKIKCQGCGYLEEVSLDFFVKLIGAAVSGAGFWAWTAFLFAGTGFALPIVIAIMSGGVAMIAFKDEIVEWIISKDYKCPSCGAIKWEATSDEKEEKLKGKDSEITELQEKNVKYEKEISDKENSYFSDNDVDDLISELDEKDKKIQDLESQKKLLFRVQKKKNIEGLDRLILLIKAKEISNANKALRYLENAKDELEEEEEPNVDLIEKWLGKVAEIIQTINKDSELAVKGKEILEKFGLSL